MSGHSGRRCNRKKITMTLLCSRLVKAPKSNFLEKDSRLLSLIVGSSDSRLTLQTHDRLSSSEELNKEGDSYVGDAWIDTLKPNISMSYGF